MILGRQWGCGYKWTLPHVSLVMTKKFDIAERHFLLDCHKRSTSSRSQATLTDNLGKHSFLVQRHRLTPSITTDPKQSFEHVDNVQTREEQLGEQLFDAERQYSLWTAIKTTNVSFSTALPPLEQECASDTTQSPTELRSRCQDSIFPSAR